MIRTAAICNAPTTPNDVGLAHCVQPIRSKLGFAEITPAFGSRPTGCVGATVSGPIGRQHVHFEAPPAERLERDTRQLIGWLEAPSEEPALIKAGVGHLWFVTLHPFDDGNGRIARAIGDLLLARADGSPQRFYSLSAQIQRERNAYYAILERTQKGTLDVTEWLAWFLATLHCAVEQAHRTLDAVLVKVRL